MLAGLAPFWWQRLAITTGASKAKIKSLFRFCIFVNAENFSFVKDKNVSPDTKFNYVKCLAFCFC
jgi:hypothetical protein